MFLKLLFWSMIAGLIACAAGVALQYLSLTQTWFSEILAFGGLETFATAGAMYIIFTEWQTKEKQ